jgi:hypothetical protein
MGLAEKQFVANLRDKRIPYHQAQLKEIFGKDIELEVQWETIETNMEALKYIESAGMGALRTALSELARQPPGKEVIAETIQKIVLVNESDIADKKVALADGVLSLHCAWDKSFDGWYSETDLAKEIGNLL